MASTGTILRVDLTNNKISTESIDPYINHFIGGRGIDVKIAFDEINPEISPFDPDNRLMFGPGVFTGTPVPAASRMEVTSMLPNGLIGSSGIGGFIGAEIKHAGYDNIVIQEQSDKPVYLLIRDDSVEIKHASHLWGLDTWETQQTIQKEIDDPDVQIMCIGPAGENLVRFSCIVTGNYSAAGHGGAGAIMGSKKLKAIAVRGHQSINVSKMDEFLKACSETRNSVVNNPARQMIAEKVDSLTVPGVFFAGIAVFGNWESDLLLAAQRVRTLERAFAYAKGIRRKDDTLPKRLLEDPISGGPKKGIRIVKERFNQMVDEYYTLSGWNNDGMPKEETFRNLGMDSEWNRFEQHMKEHSNGQTITG